MEIWGGPFWDGIALLGVRAFEYVCIKENEMCGEDVSYDPKIP